MQRSPIYSFIFAASATLAFMLFLSAYILSWSFIKKENDRSKLFLRQVKSSFDSEYRKISEEIYFSSFDSVRIRVSSIAANLHSKHFEISIFDANGACLFFHGSEQKIASGCIDFKGGMLAEVFRDPLALGPTVTYKPADKSYLYIAPVIVGVENIGYMYVSMEDPYAFYRGGVLQFLLSNFTIPMVASFAGFSLFLFVYWEFKLAPYLKASAQFEQKSALAKLAMSTAHDIQAPLEALRSIVGKTPGDISENDYTLLKTIASRIQFIGSTLLAQGPRHPESFSFVSDVVSSIVAEKEVIFERLKPTFIVSVCDTLRASCVDLDPVALGRILSNIIDNAMDALVGVTKPQIRISVFSSSDNLSFVNLSVADNGRGMDPLTLHKVISLGGTYNKLGGNGIGISGARETMASIGGRLEIESIRNVGTTVKLRLPIVARPSWLADTLRISRGKKIVILEDDESFARLLQRRLEDYECIVINDPSLFSLEKFPLASHMYLLDYQFGNSTVSGIDLIKSHCLGANAILVTSHIYEPRIQAEIKNLRATLLPKFLAATAPIQVIEPSAAGPVISSGPLMCLVDDDELVRQVWTIEAKLKGDRLLVFSNLEDFLIAKVPADANIFFDNRFDGVALGADILETLWLAGYRRLTMATGNYEALNASSFKFPIHLQGKGYPSG